MKLKIVFSLVIISKIETTRTNTYFRNNIFFKVIQNF